MKKLVVLTAFLAGFVALGTAAPRSAFAQDAATQQLLQEADKNYDQGDYDRAASNFDRAIRAQPKDVPSSAYAKRASVFLIQKHYDEGLHWIGDVAEKSWPDDDLILEQKAVILSRLPERKKDAAELAERVVTRRPTAYTLQILLGDYYYGLGAAAADKTAAHYEAYLKNRPGDLAQNDGLVRVKLGYADLHLTHFTDGEHQFDEVVRAFANDANLAANARKGLCAAYAGEQNWDRALTACERVLDEKRALHGDPSPQYNVGLAYLNRDRTDEALKAAAAYIVLKPKEPRGYLLRAEVYLRRGKLDDAETQLNIAAELAPTDAEVARELGKVYLKQKRPQKAIDKLVRVLAARTGDVDIIVVLAQAYIAAGQGDAAALQAERGLKLPGQDQNIELMTLDGEGYYVAGKLVEARRTLEAATATVARAKRPVDVRLRGLLVDTINRQAGEKLKTNDLEACETFLNQAHAIDPESTRTTFNLGLIVLERGRPVDAIKYLSIRLEKAPRDVLTNRIIARAYLARIPQDPTAAKQAADHYAIAATEASARRDLGMLAEIYTEWAPLLVDAGELDEAIAKLEQAAQASTGQPFEKATRRNLQLAYFKRGHERLRARHTTEAVSDLENATRDPGLLVGTEEDAFSFELGLAYLDQGQNNKATTIFEKLGKKSSLPFLKPPFDTVGAELFAAYTLYREGTPASRTRATTLFDHLLGQRATGALAAKLRDLQRSTWEFIGYDAYGRGQNHEAEVALKKALPLATPDRRPVIEHNLAVLDMDQHPAQAKAIFQRDSDKIPEALLNLGIVADREGDAKAAYDDFTTARSRGARGPRLDDWIEAKKRLFGF